MNNRIPLTKKIKNTWSRKIILFGTQSSLTQEKKMSLVVDLGV